MPNLFSLKKEYHAICRLLDKVQQQGGTPSARCSLSELLTMELHTFLMYLSVSDAEIKESEIQFMNRLFDTHFSAQEYFAYIEESNIYSSIIEEKLPLLIEFTAAYDKRMADAHLLNGQRHVEVTPKILQLYYHAGTRLIGCDLEENVLEKQDLDEFMQNLKEQTEFILRKPDAVSAPNVSTSIAPEEAPDPVQGLIRKAKKAPPAPKKEWIAGMHKVGVDIPQGKYKVFPREATGYYGVYADPNAERIVENDNFMNQVYIDIYDGQYLELRHSYAVPLDHAPMHYGPVYESGEYLVGIEIPEGDYKAVAVPGPYGYYGLVRFIGNGERTIDAGRSFENCTYFYAREGQILKLSRAKIE